MWGSTLKDKGHRGLKIVKHLETNLTSILLNTGKSTHLCYKSNSFSSIDLSIADVRYAPKFTCHTKDDLYESDHFPIILKTTKLTMVNF